MTPTESEVEHLRELCADRDYHYERFVALRKENEQLRDEVLKLQAATLPALLLMRWERWATAHGHEIGILDDTRDFLKRFKATTEPRR